MTKFLAALAALLLLPAPLLFCQEEEESTGGFELSIVPRMDASYGSGEFNLGNSCLYSVFEGNITDNLFFSMSNHWASFGLDGGAWDKTYYTDLYRYLGHSDWNTMLDWMYLSWSLGNFEFNVGKNLIFSEGIEGDQFDYDVHPMLASSYWNNFAGYQWGADIAWSNDAENTTLAAQIATSPYGERPFSSNLYSYGLKWMGEYGPLYNLWTVSFIGTGESYFPLVSLGQTLEVTDGLALTLDWWNAVCDEEALLLKGHSVYGTVAWKPTEKFEIQLKGGYEYASDPLFQDAFNGFRTGGALHWYPLEDMRVHAAAGYDAAAKAFTGLVGIMYNFRIHIGGK